MLAVRFDKARVEASVRALERGEAIPAPPGGWTRGDLHLLMGVAFAALASAGPEQHPDPKAMPLEHREARAETLAADIIEGARWCAEMTRRVVVGTFDAFSEPQHTVLICGDAKRVMPLEGIRTLDILQREDA